MSEANRRSTNVAMEQMIGNMTSIHSSDGQYVQLGLTPPPSPSEHLPWSPQAQYLHCQDMPALYTLNQQQQLPQYTPQTIPFNYVQPNRYVQDSFEKCVYQDLNIQNANLYHQFFISHPDLQDNNYIHARNYHDNVLNNTSQNPTHLLENVVGNWVPNTTGTYSPFGCTNSTKTGIANIFEVRPETHLFNHNMDFKRNEKGNDDLCNFHPFNNRDGKKPRIVAEVKPMRPSYSDVLAKSAPNIVSTKTNKVDVKDIKLKKENKKVTKNEKGTKANLHRLNSDIKIEKVAMSNKTEKSKNGGFEQLNRRWSSLDNMNTSTTDLNTSKKPDEISPTNKNKVNGSKPGIKKSSELDFDDLVDNNDNRNENTLNITRTVRKGNNKNNLKQKSDDKVPNVKRAQRNRKRDKQVTLGIVGQTLKEYVPGWWKLFVSICFWLVNLISDICSLSVHLSRDMASSLWNVLTIHWVTTLTTVIAIFEHMKFFSRIWDKMRKKKGNEESSRPPMQYSELDNNIAMPSTGDEAMKRLLACKGKDPYSILGVTPGCSDDDIKRYYKRQAVLVHPDKNQQPGAEEAFKILVHAFDMIGEPETRARYDRGVAESAQVEQAWSKLTELLAQLQKKVEAAANTIRCSACGLRHKRIKIDRPSYAARDCATCKIHHSAREGDIWAETKCFGFLWHYYACMDGGIYDITEWAGCQKESLKHLKPNSHNVQYRIALGKQNGQQPRHNESPRNEQQPNLENLLNSLYGNKETPQNPKRRNKKTK